MRRRYPMGDVSAEAEALCQEESAADSEQTLVRTYERDADDLYIKCCEESEDLMWWIKWTTENWTESDDDETCDVCSRGRATEFDCNGGLNYCRSCYNTP